MTARGLGMALGMALALAVGCGLATGCGDADAQGRIELTRDDLPPSAGLDDTGQAWQSAGWGGAGTGGWQPYPGETTLVVPHELGRAPTAVWVYVSFDEGGSRPGLATGDMAIVVEATETQVAVANTTEADLYCRIVLR